MSKVTRQLALQVQSGSTFESDDMTLMPFTDGIINTNHDVLTDNANAGVVFGNTPLQGNRHVEGQYTFNIDSVSVVPVLKGTLGSIGGPVLGHGEKLSAMTKDKVSVKECSNVYVKSFNISGSKNSIIKGQVTLLSIDAVSEVVV